jgi:hypothetical protein
MESEAPPYEPSLIHALPGQIVFAPSRSPAPETVLDSNDNPLDPGQIFITC